MWWVSWWFSGRVVTLLRYHHYNTIIWVKARRIHILIIVQKTSDTRVCKRKWIDDNTLRLGVELDREKFKAAQLRPLRFRVKVSVMSSFPLQYYTLVGVYCKSKKRHDSSSLSLASYEKLQIASLIYTLCLGVEPSFRAHEALYQLSWFMTGACTSHWYTNRDWSAYHFLQ